ncbi:MAG: hypothetical protein KA313_04815 [Pseudarcicella sp.]|jgi:hypothetical protein|nr:hypothetical protein [Pseudarcicella sp.]MBP6410401.1 hypothetical protein [Pseudarcicella sp.]
MKKVFALTLVAGMISLASCNEKKGETANVDSTLTETVDSAVTAVDSAATSLVDSAASAGAAVADSVTK